MKKAAKAFVTVLLSLVITLIAVMPAFAETQAVRHRVVRVGWYDEGDGANAHGYDYEYLQALAQYTGWEYKYISGTWDDCLKWLEKGEIDLLSYVQKTDERMKVFGFPNLPMAVTGGYLVTSADSKILKSGGRELDGITVGLAKSNVFNESFKEYCNTHGISDIKYKTFESFADIPAALDNGKIDAAVIAEEDKAESQIVLLSLTPQNQYLVTNKNDVQLLSELNEGLQQINRYCPYLASDLYQKYFGVNSEGKPVFTSEEEEFINSHKNILVMYDSGWPPVEYLDEKTGEYKGISPDIFALLSQKCGINFVYEGSTSGDVLAQLADGDNSNTITTISYDYNWAQQHDVYITQPFVSSAIVKLGKNLDSENATVAINEKAYFTYALKDELKGLNTKNYKKQSERLEAVRKGEADYTFVTEDQANYYRSMPKYSNLKVERMVGYEQKICVSVEKTSAPELMSIISKSLASITHDELTNIIMRNTVNSYEWTVGDFLYEYRILTLLFILLIAAIILSLSLLSRSRRLNAKKLKVAYDQKDEALKLAQQASEAKGNFMSRMSHEIRTPLNALIGYNTIARSEIESPKTDDELKNAEMKILDCLSKSDIASKHLLTVINDVLDVSAIESGKIRLAQDRFDFRGLISSLTTIFYSQAKSKGVEFDVIFDSFTEEWFIGDQLRLNQVLTNLLSNAVKFTPSGGNVKLLINQPEADTNASHIRFEVTDTGIGMDKEFLKTIWEPFEQADSSISRRFGGTGLGMTITKNIVDLMGGTIKVNSQPGVGTSFVVNLTFGRTEQPRNTAGYNFSDINALVVDDDTSTCDYISLLFGRCGARCTTALSGEAAIEAFCHAEEKGDKYTVCLVDWRMPEMDGIETIKRIREIAGDDLPIIVITAYDFSEITEKAKQVGVNMFIPKPLFQSTLFNFLVNITGIKAPEKVQKNADYDFNGTHILLAEDNEMNMEIADSLLTSVGFTIDKAENGQVACDLFSTSEEGTYKAILMDVQMPVMDGHEATKRIRASAHPEAKTIPIIAMTADAFAENIAESLSSGMDGHVSKPIDIDVLLETLKRFIK